MFYSALEALRGQPTLSMLSILRLTANPLLIPNISERTLTSLAAMARGAAGDGGRVPPELCRLYSG